MLTTQAPTRHLRCGRCGRSLQLTADKLLAVSTGRWPRCCLSPMILEFTAEAVRPDDGTKVERTNRRTTKVLLG